MILVEPQALLLPDRLHHGLALLVEKGRIAAVGPTEELAPRSRGQQSLAGTVLPGAIDLQVNGAGGVDVQTAGPAQLDELAGRVLEGGACAFLPTLITAPFDQLLRQLRVVAGWIEQPSDRRAAEPLGIHLEGPFLEVPGAHLADALLAPTSERVAALLEAGQSQLRLVTMACDLPGAPSAIAQLVRAGVAVSIGHARSSEQLDACLAAGASLATHLYNAMGPLHHREVGLASRVLDEHQLQACLIPDHLHVHPIMLRQAWRLLGPDRTILVSDCMAAAGMPDGSYALCGQPVTLADGQVRDAAGNLAGSAILMGQAIDGFAAAVPDADAEVLAQVSSRNPARALGLTVPSLAVGQPARFTVRSPSGTFGLRLDS